MNQRAAILAATLGLFCLLAGQGTAAPARQVVPIRPIPPVGPSPITADCRYLFVVDTSVTMQRYADGLYRTAHRHIATGLGGRMQEGDVFTVWTYADAVLTREFPLNAWTVELNIALANRIAVMHDGRLAQVGTAEDIYGSPQTRFVATLRELKGRIALRG